MTSRSPILTNRDHKNLDEFLGHALEDFKAGVITKNQAIGGLVQMIAAVDQGNLGEARNWVEQGRKLLPECAK
ncbi:hypothetical protein [Cupriavidus basilensis]|uniref:Uncharacterized protein n=1 Tax=Cupriavidus basilensis TaxID=68895 RepID=A0A643FSJ4_9BURK|nr:hypothetical protein [Cupriavidus basilensis]QOT82213.1 hypothetical protein F7R26_039570 [Cupriavidus basilensis]